MEEQLTPVAVEDCDDELHQLQQYVNHIQQEGKENAILRKNTLKLVYDGLKLLDEKEVKSTVGAAASPGGGEGDTGKGQPDQVPLNPSIEKYITLFPRLVSTRLSDSVERSREFAYGILELFMKHMTKEQVVELLPYLVPKLVERLGQQELIETSEEVRNVAVVFLGVLVDKMGNQLGIYIDDFLQILANTISDDFYSVRIESCKVASALAKSNQEVFHYNGERLIKPLCTSIVHQRYNVRLACVKCIGDVIQYGNHKSIEAVIPHLTQRLFDSSAPVRKGVIEVVGSWMLAFVDRYSFFHKLLPLILTGLGDESPDVTQTAKELWAKVGDQYLEENLNDYKDQADFPTPTPDHYPKDVERPNLGCRVLACQHACNLIPGLGAEITDWVSTTRIKSAQLMYNLILNSEEKITMHVEPVLQCLFKGSQDEDPIVSEYVFRSAELLGYFVPLTVTWPIISSKVNTANNDAGLVIAVSVLKGTHLEVLEKHLDEILDLISAKDICQSMKPKMQSRLLEICNILTNLKKDVLVEKGSRASSIFKVLVTILSITKDPKISGRAYDLLRKLEHRLGYTSFEELMGVYSGEILNEMIESTSDWTLVSADKQIFDLIMSQGGLAVSNNIETISDIMVANLGPDKDPEVRLRVFTMLAKHLKAYGQATEKQREQLEHFVKHVIEEVLDPNLVWVAGKTACALRTAASTCLHAILESHIMSPDVILHLSPKLETTLLGLVEDTPELTRVLACESLRLMIEGCERRIPPDRLHKIYNGLLKRLDDVGNAVRTSAACTIVSVFQNTPADYDVEFFKVHLKNVYSNLLIHMDDAEEQMQQVMFDSLKEIGKVHPSSLIQECEKMKAKHRSPALCEKLIESFSNLTV